VTRPHCTRVKERAIGVVGIWSCVGVVTALACGWVPGVGSRSVRFNSSVETARDFGLLPPIPKSLILDREHKNSHEDYGVYEYRVELIDQVNKLWQEAKESRDRGDLVGFRKLLRKYLDRSAAPRETIRAGNGLDSYYVPVKLEDRQQRRNSAVDQLDAMSALSKGSPSATVRQYLSARDAYDAGRSVEEMSESMDAATRDPNLADNVAYLRAAVEYRAGKFDQARKSFDDLACRYHRSEKREAALYMSALATLKLSAIFEAPYSRKTQREEHRSRKDAAWYAAREGFQRVMREFSDGRYFSDARGWLAYSSYRVGDWPEALVEYYRMLGDKGNLSSSLEGVFSLYVIRSHARELDMREVETRLAGEPAAALAYAYHELYNYATGYCDEPYSRGEEISELKRDALKRIANFAGGLADRPGATAAFVLRAAMANLSVGEDRLASRLARQTLRFGVTGEQRSQALWVLSVADHQLGEFASALESLRRLIAEKPDARLLERAQRYLPIVLEDMGDVEGALEAYLEIGYDVDAAYFIDVLLTPEQLAHFIETRPMNQKRDELLYALGVRYLRDRRWNDARKAFSGVRTTGRGVDEAYNHDYDRGDSHKSSQTPKLDWPNPAISGVRPQWVDQDLKTAEDLERLEQGVEQAQDNEARAEALYQVASYQYQGSLLFYNPAAWGGSRFRNLSDIDELGLFRQPGEAQTLFRYMQVHDAASRSLNLFLDVVRRFPDTRAARDALYTAAVCHERLSEYNKYWRTLYSGGVYAGPRMVTYEDVKSAYPDYQLPRGTFGWEPATRTVNGGPGWHAPPKSPKRVSRSRRCMLRLATQVLALKRQADKETLQWLQAINYLFWLQLRCGLIALTCFFWYSGFKAKRVLIAELGDCGFARALIGPARPKASVGSAVQDHRGFLNVGSPLKEYLSFLNNEARDEWCANAGVWARNARLLLLHTRSGTILILNAILYGSGSLFLLILFNLKF
jgi:outer membrane protein assembly factor BamD (BamD/ComL family)